MSNVVTRYLPYFNAAMGFHKQPKKTRQKILRPYFTGIKANIDDWLVLQKVIGLGRA